MYNDDTIVCDKVFVCAYLKKKQDSRDHFILFLHPLRIIHYITTIILPVLFYCCQFEFFRNKKIFQFELTKQIINVVLELDPEWS